MKHILQIIVSTIIVLAIAQILPGVTIDSYTTALIVAVVLALLNALIKPILFLLTLPITLITFGLFIFFLNASIVLLTDKLVDGFNVSSIWTAILFSILLSLLESLLNSILKEEKPQN